MSADTSGDTEASDQHDPDGSLEGFTFAWIVLPLGRRLAIDDGWTRTKVGLRANELAQVGSPSLIDPTFEYFIELRHVPLVLKESFDEPSGLRSVYERLGERFASEYAPNVAMNHDLDATLVAGTEHAESKEWTYAIVCVPQSGWGHDPLTAANMALDAALEVANTILLGFSAVMDIAHGPVASIRSEDIPHPVPVVLAAMLEGEPERFASAGIIWIMPRRMGTLHRGASVTPSVAARDLENALLQIEAGTPFLSYLETRRDALEQLHHHGDPRVAVLLAGIAGEVMLNTLLLHLMWEEQRDPRASSSLFDTIFKTRLATEYHVRVGGDWSGASGPVRDYLECVAHLRNLIAHTAYAPTVQEADAALKALLGMERWVGDRLASDGVRIKYPRTAFTWAGRKGLEQRQKHTKRIRRIVEDGREPGWTHAFGMWRFHFFSARGAHPAPPTGNAEFFVEVGGEAPPRYFVVDISALFAATIDDPSVFIEQGQQASLDRLEATLSASGAPRSWVRIELTRSVDWAALHLNWVPVYEFVELVDYALPTEETPPT